MGRATKVYSNGPDEQVIGAGGTLTVNPTAVVSGMGKLMVHTCVAGDASAGYVDFATSLASIAGWVVQVYRAGVNVLGDGVVTDEGSGTLRLTSGASTYTVTAGDVIMVLVG